MLYFFHEALGLKPLLNKETERTWMFIIRKLYQWFFEASPARLMVLGFAGVILAGAILLALPISHNPGYSLSFYNALFEAVSAVCVTGLTVVVPGETFSLFGRIVLASLIQIGGMGVVLMGISLILMAGGRLGFKARALFVQAQNLSGYRDVVHVAKIILAMTFSIEAIGALILWLLLARYFSPGQALEHACFLAISAFNNAGFDIFQGGDSLIPYANDTLFCLTIDVLVILGSFGFVAITDLWRKKFKWNKLLLTTKIASFMTIVLLVGGMLLLKLTTNQTWLEAFTQSVVARTAGFSTYPLSSFGNGALMIFIMLMFIGASPNSTGGGIKTTTAFVIGLKAISSTAAHDEDSVFYRRVPNLIFTKASTVLFFGLSAVMGATTLVCLLEPHLSLISVLIEVVSSFATVGSSCGITSSLCGLSKGVLMICMFIGRLGPVTIANLLVKGEEPSARYTEENVLIG